MKNEGGGEPGIYYCVGGGVPSSRLQREPDLPLRSGSALASSPGSPPPLFYSAHAKQSMRKATEGAGESLGGFDHVRTLMTPTACMHYVTLYQGRIEPPSRYALDCIYEKKASSCSAPPLHCTLVGRS